MERAACRQWSFRSGIAKIGALGNAFGQEMNGRNPNEVIQDSGEVRGSTGRS